MTRARCGFRPRGCGRVLSAVAPLCGSGFCDGAMGAGLGHVQHAGGRGQAARSDSICIVLSGWRVALPVEMHFRRRLGNVKALLCTCGWWLVEHVTWVVGGMAFYRLAVDRSVADELTETGRRCGFWLCRARARMLLASILLPCAPFLRLRFDRVASARRL